MSYSVIIPGYVREHIKKMDFSIKKRLLERILRMKTDEPGRHLKHGLGYFVENVGQYRIVYRVNGDEKFIFFVGDHKEYEKWYKAQ
jgi:mRNA-degrading endonuclease RelE of RelBE toxin-antitoxin system